MTREVLINNIREKKSYLCVGLDTDINKLPAGFSKDADGQYEYNKMVIDATRASCISYKINTAFYESLGSKGWQCMEKTIAYIGTEHFLIADAKRGDIGNTSLQYASAFFESLNVDAVTIAPYMGRDSVEPFLQYAGKWGIILGLTSNTGATDFELQILKEKNKKLYEIVLETCSQWGSPSNTMFVVGATQSAEFKNIRSYIPHHFLLVPGVGAQGGNLEDISTSAMNGDVGLIVNVSRAILFAEGAKKIEENIAHAARTYQQQMAHYLTQQ